MEYTNIDASYNGLICKKVDVIDPENHNIIEMQKIKLKDDKNYMVSVFISFITITIIILILMYIGYKFFKNINKNQIQLDTIYVFLYIIALLVLLIFLIISLIGAFNL